MCVHTKSLSCTAAAAVDEPQYMRDSFSPSCTAAAAVGIEAPQFESFFTVPISGSPLCDSMPSCKLSLNQFQRPTNDFAIRFNWGLLKSSVKVVYEKDKSSEKNHLKNL